MVILHYGKAGTRKTGLSDMKSKFIFFPGTPNLTSSSLSVFMPYFFALMVLTSIFSTKLGKDKDVYVNIRCLSRFHSKKLRGYIFKNNRSTK